MTLASGDLTTLANAKAWMSISGSGSDTIISQLISRMSAMIYGKLNRSRLYNQQFTRTLDGVGNYQLVLPDYPLTSVTSVQMGSVIVSPFPLPSPTTGLPFPTLGYGYRVVPWSGNLPGENAVIEMVNGTFWAGVQNIKVVYNAGYLIQSESGTVPATGPYTITVQQPQGIWCRDNGVVYASSGIALTPVTALSAAGQYIIPPDTAPGTYTFDAADDGKVLLISYSFIPADLEEACIQMVAERQSYRGRVGQLDKVLGGQETIRFLRGGNRGQMFPELPPEVEALIWPYVNVVNPTIGAPV